MMVMLDNALFWPVQREYLQNNTSITALSFSVIHILCSSAVSRVNCRSRNPWHLSHTQKLSRL